MYTMVLELGQDNVCVCVCVYIFASGKGSKMTMSGTWPHMIIFWNED